MGHCGASLVISIPDRSRGYVVQAMERAVASETCVTLRILISKRRKPTRPAEAMAAGLTQAGKKTSASGPLEPHVFGGAVQRTLSNLLCSGCFASVFSKLCIVPQPTESSARRDHACGAEAWCGSCRKKLAAPSPGGDFV